MIIVISCKTSKVNDSVKIADSSNVIKSGKGLFNQAEADFLVKIADARMMDAKEGALAVKRGTSSKIKDYGRLMVKEQALLLEEIKKIAASMSISLPANISADKKDGYKDLAAKDGNDFDNKFLKMMRIDHERDIRDFTKATAFADGKVKDFAIAKLPVIQSHLDKLNVLKDEQK